jgi:3-hydroxy-3-methylglutaryl CoA synthase
MIGITSYGAYVPMYRLSREELSRAWGGGGAGEKAIANCDEDSLTMGVEAAIDCLAGADSKTVDALYFASTTPPYREKQAASLMARVLDLRPDIPTIDIGNSLRSGTIAVGLALNAVKAGTAKKALVVASDLRIPAPNSEYEPLFGDGAAALMIGDSDVAVAVNDYYTMTSDFLELWKREKDTFHRTWEDRFLADEGYMKILPQAIASALKKVGLTPKDVDRAVYYAHDGRKHAEVARRLGFDPKTQVQEPLFNTIGNTGTAHSLMMLVAALENARAGEKLLWASYSDGADVLTLNTQPQIENIKNRRGYKRNAASKSYISNYEKYVKFRNLMESEAERRPADFSFLPMLWRERRQNMSLIGCKCKVCGNVQFPVQRICMWCQTKDQFEDYKLSDKKGKLFTFSIDERAMVKDPPNVLCEVDLEQGCRFYCSMTDRDPKKVDVGMEVELTFRVMHEGGGFYNYYWKCRPVRA